MTYEEAIEIYKIGQHGWNGNARDFGYWYSNIEEATELAFKCLEKQIPKKPLRYIDLDCVGYSEWCPVCEGPVERGKGCSNNDCRQAIDWSEE